MISCRLSLGKDSSLTYLSAFCVNLVYRLYGVQVIHARIDAHLVQHDDAGFLDVGLELFHGRGHVAGGDDVRLASDGGLDDGRVVRKRDERYDEVVGRNLGVEGGNIGHVKGQRRGSWKGRPQPLSGTAG